VRAILGVMVAVMLVLVLASCGRGAQGFPTYPGPQWEEGNGDPLSRDVIAVFHGDPHCQHDVYDFLHLGWPLGTPAERAGADSRQYARDTEGALAEEARLYGDGLHGDWRELSALPGDAVATGLTAAGSGSPSVELWLSESREDLVYMVVDGQAELWPLSDPPVGCD
jgi:hypothetical protein